MKHFLVALFLLFTPSLASYAGSDDVRHLLSRTGFAVTLNDMQRLPAQDYPRAVDVLLEGSITSAITPPPDWAFGPPPDFRALRKASKEEKKVSQEGSPAGH